MSDELETVPVTTADVVEATIIDESPFSSPEEAQQAMTEALTLMRDGHQAQQHAQELLEIARARMAWEVLGYSTWEQCLAEGISSIFGIKIDQAARIQIAADLRMQGLATSEIAKQTYVNPATTSRDLKVARRVGLLDEEPVAVPARDGKTYPTTRPSPPAPPADDEDDSDGHEPAAALPPAQRKPPRRPDLYKSWRNRIVDLARVTRALQSMREDDRYAPRLSDLAEGTTGDIQRAHALLTEVLQDFAITTEGKK